MKDSDRKLVTAIKAGDPGAFEELYATYFRRVHNFSVAKLGSIAEAEDVTQEVFEAVYGCLDRFEGRSDLIVWIYGITRNLLNNRLRRRSGIRLISLEEVPAEQTPMDGGPERQALAREALRRVDQVIQSLPPEQRRILELRHSKQMSIRSIARLTERSEDAVKSSLYRTRRALAARLPDEKIELQS